MDASKTLNVSIRRAIKNNKTEGSWIVKNPLTDFLSFRARLQLTTQEIQKAIYELASMERNCPAYNRFLTGIVSYEQACMNGIEKLLETGEWNENSKRSAVLLDILEQFSGFRAQYLAHMASKVIHPEQRERARQVAEIIWKANYIARISEGMIFR
ncbi:MAG: hypothetical protein Q7T16_05185 [Candidatus Burarchaeum sp.]|nr:hypothetical protein [Candidatus Burarchaeum sp.]MDO8340023.1 hypothetical protein [Candidatus Burarchaeum sp.]